MGAFTVLLDLALGIASPALGLVVDHTGLGSVFLVSTGATVSSKTAHRRGLFQLDI